MPLFYYKCACGATRKRIRPAVDANVPFECSECGGAFERDPVGPSTQAIEKLDNGMMTKAIERPADAERLFKERSKNDRSR